jgi:CHAT domain-containing protein
MEFLADSTTCEVAKTCCGEIAVLLLVFPTVDTISDHRKLSDPILHASIEVELFGDPLFDMSDAEYRAALEHITEPSQIASSEITKTEEIMTNTLIPSHLERGTFCLSPGSAMRLCPLPKTAEEVSAIYKLLKQHGWQVEDPHTGPNALEEAVKKVQHPRVLHLATHGYFEEDAPATEGQLLNLEPLGWQDPMLRSGLYFAGADHVLRLEPTADGLDDGILTALEASDLDLRGTELVVLSACDTGLGKVENGEGVFGLRRALQEAGASSVLISMWSVPNVETRELMEEFYSNWLSGMDKHEALRQAQLSMKRETQKPYFWGAFVLIGP